MTTVHGGVANPGLVTTMHGGVATMLSDRCARWCCYPGLVTAVHGGVANPGSVTTVLPWDSLVEVNVPPFVMGLYQQLHYLSHGHHHTLGHW